MNLEYLVPVPTLLTSKLSVDYDAIVELAKRIASNTRKIGFIVCDSIVGEQHTITSSECLNIVSRISQEVDTTIFLSIDFKFLREYLERIRHRCNYSSEYYIIVEVDSEIISKCYSLTSIINTIYSKTDPSNTLVFLKNTNVSEISESLRESLNLVPEFNNIVIDCKYLSMNDAVLLYGLRRELKREFNIVCYGDEGLLLKILMNKPFSIVISPILIISPKMISLVELKKTSVLLSKLSIAQKLYRYGKSMPSIIKAALHVIDSRFKPYVRPPLSTEPTYIYDYIKVLVNVLTGAHNEDTSAK